MNYYKVKIIGIDYAIGYEDLDFDPWEDCFNIIDEEEAERKADEAIKKIKDSLPQELFFDIECEPEDLDDLVCNAISEKTGWLINGFTYGDVKIK